jgi:hypothetical protein
MVTVEADVICNVNYLIYEMYSPMVELRGAGGRDSKPISAVRVGCKNGACLTPPKVITEV